MAFNIFATATSDIPLANLDANFTMIGSSAVASTLYPTATTSITYGTTGTIHYFSGSGLAVTGTLSATTTATIGAASGVKSLTVSSSDNNASVIIAAGNGATGGLRFNNYAGTQHWNIFETEGASGQQGNLSIYNEVAAATQLTLDSSGNLGLGVTPSAWDTGGSTKAIQVSSLSAFAQAYGGTFIGNNWYYAVGADTYLTTAAASRYSQAAGVHAWYNAPSGTAGNPISFTQAMTLDASGNLLVGTTSASNTVAGFATSANGTTIVHTNSSAFNQPLLTNRQDTDGDCVIFRRANITVGSISVTSSLTSYNVTSDYRLKNTIAPMTGALAKIALLKPCTYKWNGNGSDGEGFIAHELAEVVPHAVTGAKDAIDTDGNPKYQGIDVSFLVATLTAAIQEQQAIITALTTRITALEAK